MVAGRGGFTVPAPTPSNHPGGRQDQEKVDFGFRHYIWLLCLKPVIEVVYGLNFLKIFIFLFSHYIQYSQMWTYLLKCVVSVYFLNWLCQWVSYNQWQLLYLGILFAINYRSVFKEFLNHQAYPDFQSCFQFHFLGNWEFCRWLV